MPWWVPSDVRSGLSSTVSSRFTFGTYGAIIFGLINALCNFGWFGYQCTFFGSSITSMFKLAAGIEVNLTACIVIGGLLMMITAIVGYKGIKVLSQFGCTAVVPAGDRRCDKDVYSSPCRRDRFCTPS